MVPFSDSAQAMRSSEIRDILKVTAGTKAISFAGGNPCDSLFPTTEVDEIMQTMPDELKQAAFQYAPTPGYPPLRESVTEYLRNKRLPVDDNELLITTGSLQAIYLIAKVFLNPGDVVITEYPVFIGATAAFKALQADIQTVPIDDEGPILSELEELLNSKPTPKLLYLTPYYHNPAGIVYSAKRKQALIELLKTTDTVVIEDDPYGELYFEESGKELVKPMKAINQDYEHICYTSSFSKILGPGMRLGFLLGPTAIINKCELAKQAIDACSPTFTQVIAHQFMVQGKLLPYLARIRKAYAKRCQLALGALDKYMPVGITWTKPKGGFYIWVTLPAYMDATDVMQTALKNGAVFIIGKTFDPHGERNNCLRIAYSQTPLENIEPGIKIISDAVKKHM
ncbi:PLP-dependent aminotransferase family protein [bacterium]|nr:PLP-dependent aminotransferase family protein [bacterium]